MVIRVLYYYCILLQIILFGNTFNGNFLHFYKSFKYSFKSLFTIFLCFSIFMVAYPHSKRIFDSLKLYLNVVVLKLLLRSFKFWFSQSSVLQIYKWAESDVVDAEGRATVVAVASVAIAVVETTTPASTRTAGIARSLCCPFSRIS